MNLENGQKVVTFQTSPIIICLEQITIVTCSSLLNFLNFLAKLFQSVLQQITLDSNMFKGVTISNELRNGYFNLLNGESEDTMATTEIYISYKLVGKFLLSL